MTRDQVYTAVIDALLEAQQALSGEVQALFSDTNPFDAIPGLDSLATVEVTTTICVRLGISDTKRNPFLENARSSTIGQVIEVFCSLSGATE